MRTRRGCPATGDERPELATALLWVEEKKAQSIAAPNLDRLARELVVQEAALAQCWKHGGRAFMADQGEILPDDPEGPMCTAMRQMMGVFAQLDRGMTVAKLRRGRRIKGEKGQYAYGAPPYGWQAHKKELSPEEMEQAGRARARQLRDEEELSFREIAPVLEAEDIRPKRGERWHPETVRRLLANTSDRPPTLRKRTAYQGISCCRPTFVGLQHEISWGRELRRSQPGALAGKPTLWAHQIPGKFRQL